MYKPSNLPDVDLYVLQAKVDHNWREADRLMTRCKDWWNVKWAGRKRNNKEKNQVNSQSESDTSESEFSGNNPQKYQQVRACQLTKITTCSVVRVIMLPAVNDDFLSVMQRGDGGCRSDKGGFGSRTESAKFRSDPKPETESSMDDSKAGTLTPGPGGADDFSDWDDGSGMYVPAQIEPSQPGGQDPVSTSATQGSASVWGNPGPEDLGWSFWDNSSDQLTAQAQMAFYGRLTHTDGQIVEVVAQRQNRAVAL